MKKKYLYSIYLYLFFPSFILIANYPKEDYFKRLLYNLSNPNYLLVFFIPAFISFSIMIIEKYIKNYKVLIRFKSKKEIIKNIIFELISKQSVLFFETLLIILIANNLGGTIVLEKILPNLIKCLYQILRIYLFITCLGISNIYILLFFKKSTCILYSFIIIIITFLWCPINGIFNFISLSTHLYFNLNVVSDIIFYTIIFLMQSYIYYNYSYKIKIGEVK